MTRLPWIFGLMAGIATLVGCGGGGQSYPSGTICPSSYNPIPVALAAESKAQKLSLDPLLKQIPAGDYSYASAQVYYQDTATGIKMHFMDFKDPRTNVFSPKIVCLANLKPEMDPIQFSAEGVSKMAIDSSGKALFDVRQYFIRFEERNWVKKFVEIDGSPFNSPNKVYDSAGVESAFYKMGPTDEKNFEIRSKISISPTATVSLQIVLSRTPPPATP